METVIKLSIQEIIYDFEKLVRYDEKLGIYFDFKRAQDEDISDFYKKIEELGCKYLPRNYDDILAEGGNDEYDRALALYKALYSNFVEMFTQLV